MTHTTSNNPKVGDLVVKSTSMGTDLGIIRTIDQSVTTPYFVEWISGYFCGFTTGHCLDHVQQWRKNL